METMTAPASLAGAAPGTHEHDAQRIEILLEQVQAMAGPSTWQGVEELVERLVGLYGEAFRRTLEHARQAGADGGQFDARLGDDELVSSLLLIHGLHPVPAYARVERALDGVRAAHGCAVELAGIDERGIVRLILPAAGDASSRAELEASLRRSLEAAAPELRISIENPPAPGASRWKLPVLSADAAPGDGAKR